VTSNAVRAVCGSGIPIDGDLTRDVGVTFEPAPRERAERHDGEAVARRVLDRRGDEAAADPAALERVGDLGVHEHEAPTVLPVHELGEVAVEAQFEAMFRCVVDHSGFVVHHVQPRAPRSHANATLGSLPASYRHRVTQSWQVETERPLDESVCRVLGGNGSVQRCVLRGETDELPLDVVEVRLVPQRFERGCRLPAHGTLTVDVRADHEFADHAWHALKALAQSRVAVTLQRPDGGAIEMRLGPLAATRTVTLADGSRMRSTVTYSWHSP
jgi:hypothetical protein